MTILEAGLKSSVYDAARAYLTAGVSVIPVRGKQPTLKSWVMWQQHRPTMATLDQWHKAELLSGVGVICGKVSNNLVVVDLDSLLAVQNFEESFPNLLDTYAILSGSRRGLHYYYYVDNLPPTTIAPLCELRANGSYVVAAPSLHASGNHYSVEQRQDVMRVHNLENVVAWIKAQRPAPELNVPIPRTPARPVALPGRFIPRDEYFARRYTEAALDKQVTRVKNTSVGNRNRQLYLSAIALGQLVGSGAIDRTHVESELLAAALHSGLGETESLATIKSGINTGELNPRDLPPAPPKLTN